MTDNIHEKSIPEIMEHFRRYDNQVPSWKAGRRLCDEIDSLRMETEALKGAVRSAVQQCNDKDEDYAALERMYIQHRDECERLREADMGDDALDDLIATEDYLNKEIK